VELEVQLLHLVVVPTHGGGIQAGLQGLQRLDNRRGGDEGSSGCEVPDQQRLRRVRVPKVLGGQGRHQEPAARLDGEEALALQREEASGAGVALMSSCWATVSGRMNSPALSWPEMMSSRTCAAASSLSCGPDSSGRVGSLTVAGSTALTDPARRA